MSDIDMVIRRNDYSLSPEQEEVRVLFADFFKKEVPSTRVRAAEPVGFDSRLWKQLVELGAISMGLPESQGGAGSSMVDLTLVAEQAGRYLAPVPLVEATVVARLLSGAGADSALIAVATSGARIFSIAMFPDNGDKQLVPAGAVATGVIVLAGDKLVLVSRPTPPAHVKNQGSAPLAWWSFDEGSRTVLASGERARNLYANAIKEWKLLTAAALAGCGDTATKLTVDYAKVRYAFGQPIGTFQAVANALVDAAIGVEGARHLTWKAAWYYENDPEAEPAIVSMAYAYACQAATRATTAGVHFHGGTGFMNETDITLYFLRVKAWSVVGGDPKAELMTIADALFSGAPVAVPV
jgi:alkylation response protein AidB-like acyl-CoA dehydrogenase